MELAIQFLIVLGVACYGIYQVKKRADKDKAIREEQFRAVMLSLEEKAKREGTFVISYFDKEGK